MAVNHCSSKPNDDAVAEGLDISSAISSSPWPIGEGGYGAAIGRVVRLLLARRGRLEARRGRREPRAAGRVDGLRCGEAHATDPHGHAHEAPEEPHVARLPHRHHGGVVGPAGVVGRVLGRAGADRAWVGEEQLQHPGGARILLRLFIQALV